MKPLAATIIHMLLDDDGATAVEYATIIGLIFLVVLASINLLGQATSTSFNDSSNSIDAVIE